MATITTLGAGMNGLTTAMLLARDGHEVTVLERDPGRRPRRPRRGTGGSGGAWASSATCTSRCRAGPGDGARRPTSSTTLRGGRRAALQPGRRPPGAAPGPVQPATTGSRRHRPPPGARGGRGAAVELGPPASRWCAASPSPGSRGRPRVSGLPHVAGVRTEEGGSIRADLVVDCPGRPSRLSDWLADAGARPPAEERENSGVRRLRPALPARRRAGPPRWPPCSSTTLR